MHWLNYVKPCPCGPRLQPRVLCEGNGPPKLCTQSLLFAIVLDALAHEFRSWVSRDVLYADDLVIIADSLEECFRGPLIWREAMEKKGLRVNAGKTKVMICGL